MASEPTMLAIELIAAERQRQRTVEGFDARHDDMYGCDELARAAATYALPQQQRVGYSDERTEEMGWPPDMWPWEESWWKPTPHDRIRELVKAGALIVAEIERLQRKEATPT